MGKKNFNQSVFLGKKQETAILLVPKRQMRKENVGKTFTQEKGVPPKRGSKQKRGKGLIQN